MSAYERATELERVGLPGSRTPAALQFTRQYVGDMLDTNYSLPYSGPLGARWTHNYNLILSGNGTNMEVRTWDGSVEVYVTNTPTGGYDNLGDGDTKLTATATGYAWQLRQGTIYNFTNAAGSYRLLSIVDPIGNTNSLKYDASGLLTNVFDNVGRSNKFTYTAAGYISNFVDPIGRTTTYKYDTSGQLTNVSDSIGSKVTFGYSGTAGIINTITNARGKVHTYVYDGFSKVTAQTNNAGVATVWNRLDSALLHYVTNITYDGLGGSNVSEYVFNDPNRLVLQTNAAGGKTEYVLDSLNRPTQVIDPMGFVTTNTYVASGCPCVFSGSLINSVDPLGRTNQWQYETTYYNRTAFTNARNFVTRWTYDAKGNNTNMTDALTFVTTYAYDSKGNRTNTVDANNKTNKFSYDSYGSATNWTDANGNATTYRVDIIGRITNTVDALTRTNQWFYDARDRITLRVDALGKTNGYAYDAMNNLTARTNELNYVTSYAFDNLDRLTTVTQPASNAAFMSYGYDYDGNRNVATNALGNATRYTYDVIHRMTAITNALSKVWKFSYDADSRRTNSSDPNGHANWFVYDNAGQLTAMTNALNQVVKFQYDLTGNRTNIVDAKANAMGYTYDPVNQLTNINYAASDNEKFVYDPVGNLTNFVTRAGQTNFYTYDAGNRLATNNWLGDTNVTWFSFDGANQLILGQRKVGSANTSKVLFSYNNAGRLTNESQLMTTSTNRSVQYQYNDAGWLTNLIYPDGSYVGYQYNSNGWVTNILDYGTNSIVKYEYDAAGRRTKQTMSNNVFTTYEYDAANQVTNVWNQFGAFTTTRFQYGYDDAGNRTWVKRNNNKGDVFKYDGINQVTNVVYEATNVDTTPVSFTNKVTYYFDAAGNRTGLVTTNSGGQTSNGYVANALNQYTSVASVTHRYDQNGNLTNDASWQYFYDRENRLLLATNGVVSVTNTYDAFNRLVERQVGANKTRFIYDKSWRVLAEYDQNNALVAKYVYGPGIDEPVRMFRNSAYYYYEGDALGNVVAIRDGTASANLVESYSYDVFGTPTIYNNTGGTPIASSTVSNRFMFQGRDRDPDTGLYNFRNRYYHPGLGRFMQVDPIRQKGGVNLYRFVINSPTSYRDPWGLIPGLGFKTPQEAARDAICWINPLSIADNIEFGGLIYFDPNSGLFFATYPKPGSSESVNPLATTLPPMGTLLTGDYHTHGDYSLDTPSGPLATSSPFADDFNSDNFSRSDQKGNQWFQNQYPGFTSFLGTPSGAVRQSP